MKIDWKRKLTSRKFWAMLAGVVIGIVVYARSAEKPPEALAGIFTSAGALIAYMVGEGLADGNHISDTSKKEDNDNGSK